MVTWPGRTEGEAGRWGNWRMSETPACVRLKINSLPATYQPITTRDMKKEKKQQKRVPIQA